MADEKMIWIDIETTGLEPTEDVILELGLTITDKFGNQIDSGDWLVGEVSDRYSEAIERGKKHDIVGPMHEANNLWEDWEYVLERQEQPWNATAVEQDAIEFLKYYNIEPNTLPMCGASVGSLDRPFLKEHMPNLLEFFHYRIIDISTIRALADMHNPRIGRAGDHSEFESPGVPHRVLYDINYSIFEYKHYIDNFFFLAD